VLLLSARMDNLLPNNPLRLEQPIGATDAVDLSAFADFVAFAQVEEPNYEDRSAKRRIPDPVRAQVLLRDGARCRRCRTAINLEVDHIIPVSKGGKTVSEYHTRDAAGSETRRFRVLCQCKAEPVGCGAVENPLASKSGSNFAFADQMVFVRVLIRI
jgi:hypothetical protein